MRRGQASIEMIVGVGFLIAIFIIVVFISMENSSNASELKTYMDVVRIGNSIKDNIEAVHEQGYGYHKYFSIPYMVHGFIDYNVSVNGGILTILYDGRAWSTRLGTTNVTIHTLDKGSKYQNRVRFSEKGVEIMGHRPNLIPVRDSLRIALNSTTGNVTMFLRVKNDAHVESGDFIVKCIQNGVTNSSNTVSPAMMFLPVPPEGYVDLNVSDAWINENVFNYIVEIDSSNMVNESVETDNTLNISVDWT